MLVEDLEELVEAALQEVDQPLNQLGLDTPYCSPVHTPIHSPPHSPPKIMAYVNENQPNPPPSWKARSPLNLAPPLHDCLKLLRKCCLSLTQVKKFRWMIICKFFTWL